MFTLWPYGIQRATALSKGVLHLAGPPHVAAHSASRGQPGPLGQFLGPGGALGL